MFNVNVPEDILEKFREMVEEEGDDACVRIREYKIGAGWHAKIILGPSIDEWDEDEDEKITVEGVDFIIENDLITKYGATYSIMIDENQSIAVRALTLW